MKMNGCKRIFTIILAVMAIFSQVSPAIAADATVTFDDNKLIVFEPGSVYTQSDLFDNFKGVMPGDKLEQVIEVENRNDDYDYIQVYLRAVLHDEADNPISENVLAELQADTRRGNQSGLDYMLEFLSKLKLKVWNGTELIYESSPDQAGGLASNVYLGTLRKLENLTLKAELEVPIELGNEYANRIGEVDWAFVVEGFEDIYLTVQKVWEDDGIDRPESVTVNLLKDGVVEDSIQLNEENHWTYTWDRLEREHVWTAEEIVPEGYEATYELKDGVLTITNKKTSPPIVETELTVKKVWSDTGVGRPGSVEIWLLKDGIKEGAAVLSEQNQWTYTWKELDDSFEWSVVESTVPNGYTVSYAVDGTVVTVTNTKTIIPPADISLTVRKVWNENKGNQPSQIGVILYNGSTPVETVYLSAANYWTYTWTNLSGHGNWNAVEIIPRGYTPYYSYHNDVITITNTDNTLLKTGQNNWLVPVLASVGVLLIGTGIVLRNKKQKLENE